MPNSFEKQLEQAKLEREQEKEKVAQVEEAQVEQDKVKGEEIAAKEEAEAEAAKSANESCVEAADKRDGAKVVKVEDQSENKEAKDKVGRRDSWSFEPIPNQAEDS